MNYWAVYKGDETGNYTQKELGNKYNVGRNTIGEILLGKTWGWLTGITREAEKEQKYNVNFRVNSSFGAIGIFLYKEGDEVLAGNNFGAYFPKKDEYRLTEQEIRDFQNGDILFEHFAVKVEELEE